ncbi:hypothetical protein [Ornithinimicrobium kibberense]|uniref:hypothetical protein n=1 Tax=Ornithinimicrobium kibberense TaxID=282060 RepID=UPI0036102ED8
MGGPRRLGVPVHGQGGQVVALVPVALGVEGGDAQDRKGAVVARGRGGGGLAALLVLTLGSLRRGVVRVLPGAGARGAVGPVPGRTGGILGRGGHGGGGIVGVVLAHPLDRAPAEHRGQAHEADEDQGHDSRLGPGGPFLLQPSRTVVHGASTRGGGPASGPLAGAADTKHLRGRRPVPVRFDGGVGPRLDRCRPGPVRAGVEQVVHPVAVVDPVVGTWAGGVGTGRAQVLGVGGVRGRGGGGRSGRARQRPGGGVATGAGRRCAQRRGPAGVDHLRGPGRQLPGQLAGGVRCPPEVGPGPQHQPAEGVEVAGDAPDELGGCGQGAVRQPAGQAHPGHLLARPPRGETGVEQADQVRGVDDGRLVGRDVVGALQRGGDPDPGDLDGAVAGAQDRVGVEVEVVQPAASRRLQPGGGLADDAAGLLGGQRRLGDERGQRLGLAQALLDDPGEAVPAADVEDADQPGVVDGGDPAGAVEGRLGGVGVPPTRRQHRDGDQPAQRDVPGRPVVQRAALTTGQQLLERVAVTEHGAHLEPVHVAVLPVLDPGRGHVVVPA